MPHQTHFRCATCGTLTHIDLLDGKPESLKGVQATAEQISAAADRGEQFDVLECRTCYGPAWSPAYEVQA